MLGRIVELAEDDRYISVHRGFLVVSQRGSEQGRVALDDVAALIGNAHGLVYSNNVLTALAERGVPVVLCGANHRPHAVVWPLDNHFQQAGRIQAQAAARRPLKKRIWQIIVQKKVAEQANVLEACGKPFEVVRRLAGKVRSGDPDNFEAQAARHYWRLLMGKDFKRDPDEDGVNSLLNYGYAVLRASVARAVVAAGMHPSIGIFHRSAENAFQLVDDLMEVHRPLVDAAVVGLVRSGATSVDREVKRRLAMLMYRDCETDEGLSPLIRCIEKTALSLSRMFEGNSDTLLFPARHSLEALRLVIVEMEGTSACCPDTD